MERKATIAEMESWARGHMLALPPNVVIGAGTGPEGRDYIRRWHMVPHNPLCNVYLHQFGRSDDDRALHDHPWANTSTIIAGRYWEHVPPEVSSTPILRSPGDHVTRKATEAHRIEIIDPEVISLFVTGPKIREWGFLCPGGWLHWEDFGDRGGCGHGSALRNFK